MGSSSYIYLLVLVFIVFRYAIRELRPRVITARIWIAPAIFVALLLWVFYGVAELEPGSWGLVLAWLAGGLVVGAVAGFLIIKNTRILPGPRTGTVIAQGNYTTLAIWIVAIAIRFVVRFFATGSIMGGGTLSAQLAPNAGTIAVVLAAFTIIAATFSKHARAHVMPVEPA
jgi:hypothetical protein